MTGPPRPPLEALAAQIRAELCGAFLGKVFRPDPWTLGVGGGKSGVLGFCWHPANLAAGFCRWPWPRGTPPDILKARLQGALLQHAETLPEEPVLLLRLAGGETLAYEALGRSSNILLLSREGSVLWSGRILGGEFRSGAPGSHWEPPRGAGCPRPRPPEAEEEGDRLLGGLAGRLRASASRALAKRERALERRRDAVVADREEGVGWLVLEARARALLASGDLQVRGAPSRRVVDYSTDPPSEEEVRLDPALTVRENCERMFRAARRGRLRIERAAPLLRSVEADLEALRRERLTLDALDPEEMIRLHGEGREKAKAPRGRIPKLPKGVVRLSLPEGFAGFAGKDAHGNFTASFRLGRGGDFWYHAADYPGSHVVVRNPDRLPELPRAVESAAALYAATHSSAPPGNRVAVVAARCKDLRPAPGRPGEVFLSGGRTVFVDLPRR